MFRNVVIVSVLLAALSTPVRAQTPREDTLPTIVTSGEGVVKRAPDRAWVSVTAESRAKTPREAQRMNAEAMSAVLQKLKGAGLAGDAIQTRGYDLQPEFDYVNGRQVLRAYLARNTLEVRVDDLPRLGEILDFAVTSGATSVGNVRFDLKEREAAERAALRQAVEDARARAEAAAAGANVKIERVLRIEEHRAPPPPYPIPMTAMRAETSQAAAPPPISPGELEIRVNVTMTVVVRQ